MADKTTQMNDGLGLPYSLEAEQSVLGAVLVDPEQINQVADMLKRMLKLDDEMTGPFLDATDALAAAYCHYLQMDRPVTTKAYSSWKDFIAKNPGKVVK